MVETVKTPGAFWSKKDKVLVVSDFGLHFFKGSAQKIDEEIEWFSIEKYSCTENSINIKSKNKQLNK